MDFRKWYTEVASVPARDSKGNWYDMKNNRSFDDYDGVPDEVAEAEADADPVRAEREAQHKQRVSAAYAEREAADKRENDAALKKAKEARAAAKTLGGTALTGGSAKQKKWAEELRAGALKNLSSETAAKVLEQAQFKNTLWWIDNRESFSFSETSFGKKVTAFRDMKATEAAFKKHLDRPRIDAFQKPLREVFERFEKRYEQCRNHNIFSSLVLTSDRVLVEECRRVLSSDSTDMEIFAGLMDRLLPRLEAITR